MNKRILVTAMVAASGLATLSLAAFAAPTAGAQNANQPAAATPAPQAAAPATTPKAVPPVDSRQCIRDTGSHIPPPKGQCLPVAGRSYNQEDIRRTGAVTTGQALRMLDPSVTVHGH